jgi:hypothetical protein
MIKKVYFFNFFKKSRYFLGIIFPKAIEIKFTQVFKDKISFSKIGFILIIAFIILFKNHNNILNTNFNNLCEYNKSALSYITSYPIKNNTSNNTTHSGLHDIIDIEDNIEFYNSEIFFEFKKPVIIKLKSLLTVYIETKKFQFYIDITSPPPQV